MIPEGHVGSLVHQMAERETAVVHVKCFQLTSDLMSVKRYTNQNRTILLAIILN